MIPWLPSTTKNNLWESDKKQLCTEVGCDTETGDCYKRIGGLFLYIWNDFTISFVDDSERRTTPACGNKVG